jgi:hypothetical protein
MAITAFPYTAVLDVSASTLLGNNTGSPAAAIALTATQVRTLLSVYTSAQVDALLANYQPLDADLTAIAALTTTTFGRSLLTQADAAATRTTIGAGTSSFSGAYGDLSGIPSTFTPSAHKTSHATGGSDALTAADIGAAATSHTHAASDITSGTISTARLAGGTASASTYLRGDQTWATVSAGISSLNGLTDATQTFAVGTTGTDVAFSSAAGVHTLSIPSASATARGVVTTGTQTIAGAKTFSSKITAPASGSVNGGIGNGSNGIDFFQGVIVYVIGDGSSLKYLAYFCGMRNTSSNPTLKFASDACVSWDSGTDPTATANVGDTRIYRDAAYIVSLKSTTNACGLRVYNTETSATSFERLNIGWSGNVCTIETDKGSAGGTLRGLKIGGASTSLLGFYGATPVDRPDTVADPTGGSTIDTEARTAINTIIDRLQELGLIA